MRGGRKSLIAVLLLLAVLGSGLTYFAYTQVQQDHLNHDLKQAISKNDNDQAATLLDSGADANVRFLPRKPLSLMDFWTAWWHRDENRYPTALMVAAIRREDSIVRLLLEHGADVNSKETTDG